MLVEEGPTRASASGLVVCAVSPDQTSPAHSVSPILSSLTDSSLPIQMDVQMDLLGDEVAMDLKAMTLEALNIPAALSVNNYDLPDTVNSLWDTVHGLWDTVQTLQTEVEHLCAHNSTTVNVVAVLNKHLDE